MTEFETYQKLLHKKKIKSADVAKATGLSNATFSDWKNGRSKPKQEKLQKIADYFGVTVEYLIYGEEKKDPISLTSKEKLDLIKDAETIMKKIKQGDSVIIQYNDAELTEIDKQLLRELLLSVCRLIKIMKKSKKLGDEH